MIQRLIFRLRAPAFAQLRRGRQATARVQNSSFELVELIDIRGAIVAINGDDHCQANSGFGGGDRDGKDCEHHAGWRLMPRTKTPERDEIQVRRGKHQLDADQDENRVTPAQCGEQADGKQRSRYDEENLESWGHCVTNWIGERTRLACWFRRRAETSFSLNLVSAGREEVARKARDREDAPANTRDACATQVGIPRVIASPPSQEQARR